MAVFIRATVRKQYKIYAIHPERMNTDMGRVTAKIELEVAAEGIYRIATGLTEVKDDGFGFIKFQGECMTI